MIFTDYKYGSYDSIRVLMTHLFPLVGLSDPILIRLDVDSKLSDQLSLSFLSCRPDDKIGETPFIFKKKFNSFFAFILSQIDKKFLCTCNLRYE